MKEEIKIDIQKKNLIYFSLILAIVIGIIYTIIFTEISMYNISLIFLFILFGAISRLPQRMSQFSLGLELITLFTVVSAILYGRGVGAFLGIAGILLSGIYIKEAPQDMIIAAIGLAVLGWFAPSAYNYFGNIAITGLFLTVCYDFFTNVAYVFMGHSIVGCLKFSALHIPSNYLILKYFGEKLLVI